MSIRSEESARMYMAEKLREARLASGLSVDEVGAQIARSGKTISAWEIGKGQPDSDLLVMLCRLYKVPIDFFYEPEVSNWGGGYGSGYGFSDGTGYGGGSAGGRYMTSGTTTSSVDIPIYGSIAAGKPIEMIEVDDYYSTSKDILEKYPQGFFLRVKGESMNRRIPNGSLAFIDPSQKNVVDMNSYALCINGYDATIKRVHPLNNGFELVPDSYDPTFVAEVFNYNEEGTDEITIIGKVVWVTFPFDYDI